MREGWREETRCGDGWVSPGAAVDADQPDLAVAVVVFGVLGW